MAKNRTAHIVDCSKLQLADLYRTFLWLFLNLGTCLEIPDLTVIFLF